MPADLPRLMTLRPLAATFLCGAVLLLALCAAVLPAHAATGAVLSGALVTDRGYSIPLPAGRWRVTHTAEQPQTDHTMKISVLRNEAADPLVPYLILRWASEDRAWSDFCNPQTSGQAFGVERLGSQPNQIVQRCARMYVSALPHGASNPWWKGLDQGFLQVDSALRRESMLLAELSSFRWKGAYARVEAFIRSGRHGVAAATIRDDWTAGRPQPWRSAVEAWTQQYLRQMEESVLNGRSVAVAMLQSPTATSVDEKIRQMAGAGTGSRPNTQPASGATAPAAMSREQIEERIRQMAEATRVPGPPAAPAPVTAAPLAPTAAAVPVTGQPPAPSSQELARLAAEVARLREELKSRPPEQAANAARNPPPAQAAPSGARRLALVIGNDAYQGVAKLQNARSDARAMGDMLTRLGYRVRVRVDLSERALKDELRSFKSEVQGGDEVLFFFAGHGVQLAGANYLLPTDIRGDSEDQVRDDALPLQKVLDDIQERKARFALAIVDACRDNPFRGVAGRSIGTRGLAPTTAATGQMVMFSAGAGQQALDRLNDRDRDPNGLFTRVLLKELDKPGQSVDRVLRTVRTQVVEMARSVGHEQVPALYDQTVGEFFFRR